MCNQNHSTAELLIDFLNQLKDLLGSIVIQRAGRFIAEQNVRILDHGSADRGSLLLSARKLIWDLIPMFSQSQRL